MGNELADPVGGGFHWVSFIGTKQWEIACRGHFYYRSTIMSDYAIACLDVASERVGYDSLAPFPLQCSYKCFGSSLYTIGYANLVYGAVRQALSNPS